MIRNDCIIDASGNSCIDACVHTLATRMHSTHTHTHTHTHRGTCTHTCTCTHTRTCTHMHKTHACAARKASRYSTPKQKAVLSSSHNPPPTSSFSAYANNGSALKPPLKTATHPSTHHGHTDTKMEKKAFGGGGQGGEVHQCSCAHIHVCVCAQTQQSQLKTRKSWVAKRGAGWLVMRVVRERKRQKEGCTNNGTLKDDGMRERPKTKQKRGNHRKEKVQRSRSNHRSQ